MKFPLPLPTMRAIVADWAEGRTIHDILDADEDDQLTQELVETCIRFAFLHPDKLKPRKQKGKR